MTNSTTLHSLQNMTVGTGLSNSTQRGKVHGDPDAVGWWNASSAPDELSWWNASSDSPSVPMPSSVAITGLGTLLCLLLFAGFFGNIMLLIAILSKARLRQSITNYFLLSRAAADLLALTFGVPDTVLFLFDRGFLLPLWACRVIRFGGVSCLYISVLTLTMVSAERYIAIVKPLKTRVLLSRRRIVWLLVVTWLFGLACGLVSAPFLVIISPPIFNPPRRFCILQFSANKDDNTLAKTVFQYVEFAVFYLVPVMVQTILYVRICHLLCCRRSLLGISNGVIQKRDGQRDVRRGVVMVLVASLVVYFVSYSPHQVLLVYNTFAHSRLSGSWMFFVFVTALTYLNAAANPYFCFLFARNFRSRLVVMVGCKDKEYSKKRRRRVISDDGTTNVLITAT